jgi:hypothetical protein
LLRDRIFDLVKLQSKVDENEDEMRKIDSKKFSIETKLADQREQMGMLQNMRMSIENRGSIGMDYTVELYRSQQALQGQRQRHLQASQMVIEVGGW